MNLRCIGFIAKTLVDRLVLADIGAARFAKQSKPGAFFKRQRLTLREAARIEHHCPGIRRLEAGVEWAGLGIDRLGRLGGEPRRDGRWPCRIIRLEYVVP